MFWQSFLATEKKCGHQEVTESRHFEIARDTPGEEKVPLIAVYLSTRTAISAFKVSSNLGEAMVCAFPNGTKLKYTRQRKASQSEHECKNEIEIHIGDINFFFE